jgi:hypothetical protein
MGYTAYDPSLYLKGGAAAYAVGSAAYNYYNQQFDPQTKATSGTMSGAASVRRRSRRTGRTRRRNVNQVWKHVLGEGQNVVTRWQLGSSNYIGAGKVPIEYRRTTTGTVTDYIPIHFMSLTTLSGAFTSTTFPTEDPINGIYKHGLCRMLHQPATSRMFYQPMQVNTSDGYNNYNSDGLWQYEQNAAGINTQERHNGKHFHKWTDIKMNLYGAMYMPVTYTISLVQFRSETLNPNSVLPVGIGGLAVESAIEPYTECNNLFRDMLRPLIGQNMNGNGFKPSNEYRIVKKEVIKIDPMPVTEAIAEDTTSAIMTGNIRELRWFIRHDRFRNYAWSERIADTTQDTTFNDGGWDLYKRGVAMGDVAWDSRLYLLITCTAPELGTTANGYPEVAVGTTGGYMNTSTASPADKWMGSYDIAVRNSFIIR